MVGHIGWKDRYPDTIFRQDGPSPVIAMLYIYMYMVKPVYNGTIGNRNFFRCRNVPFNTRICSLDH